LIIGKLRHPTSHMPDFAAILRDALSAADCKTGTLHVFERASGALKLMAHVGLPAPVAKIVESVPVGKGMAGVAAERRQPVQTCNLQTDNSRDIRPGAKAVPVQASIALPILTDGQLRGVLGLAKAEAHQWSETEIQALEELAARIGRHIEYPRE
jgi:L-methionine (R)-S-oxide reductase